MDLAIGPDALLNMDGPSHEALRRSLGPLFTPEASGRLVGASTEPWPTPERAARGRRGGRPRPARRGSSPAGRRSRCSARRTPPGWRRGLPRVVSARRAAGRHDGPGDPARRAAPPSWSWPSGSSTSWRRPGARAGSRRRDDRPAARARVRLGGGQGARRHDDPGRDRDGHARRRRGSSRCSWTTGAGPRWAMAGDPAAVDPAIEAGLRLVTPTEVIVRSCAEDATVDGSPVPAGRAALPVACTA